MIKAGSDRVAIGNRASQQRMTTPATTGTINTSLGVRARSLRGISGELEYGTSSGAGKVQSQTIRAGLKVPF